MPDRKGLHAIVAGLSVALSRATPALRPFAAPTASSLPADLISASPDAPALPSE